MFYRRGLWMPMPAELSKVRQEIDYNFNEFKKIIGSKKFKSVYGDLSRESEYILTRVPKGYETGNPRRRILKIEKFCLHTPSQRRGYHFQRSDKKNTDSF